MNIIWITKLINESYKTSRLKLAEGLRRRNHNVILLMAKKIGDKKSINKNQIYLPTANYPLLSGLFFGIIIFFYLPFIIRKKKVDIAIIDGTHVFLPFTLPIKLFGIPLILDIRTLPIDKKRPILFDISLYLSKYVTNGLTTITPELGEILKKKYHLQNKKIGIWSSGVSIQNFTKPSIIKGNINALKKEKEFILMCHGSYSPARGIENLIKSIGNLENSLRKKIKLLIIGIPLNKIEDLTWLCKEVKVKEQVEFIPQVEYEEIPSYISLCDIGIIPLPPENKWWQVSSPLKTLEYLAMGKPIIATNIPFHQRIFDKGECGVLLDTNHPKALANAITYVYQNREKLDTMGKKGREIVENYYTWDIKALEVEKFIETVLADY